MKSLIIGSSNNLKKISELLIEKIDDLFFLNSEQFKFSSWAALNRDNVTFYQWRTIKELDGVFNNLEYDPQIIDLKGSLVTRLPDTYNGMRLGHNWSLSWVAEKIAE